MNTSLIPLFLSDLKASVPDISFILFISGLVSTSFMIASGLLSDALSSKLMITLSFALITLGSLFLPLCSSWYQTIPWVALLISSMGVFLPPRMLIIARLSDPQKRGATYGFMNISWPLGGIFGPLLGGIIADIFGWNLMFYSLTIISLICMPLTLLIKEKSIEEKGEEFAPLNTHHTDKILLLNLLFYTLSHFLLSTGRGILDPILPIYLQEKFSISKTEIGAFLSLGSGLSTLLTQIPSGFLGDKYGHKRAMILFTFPISLLMITWPWINDLFLLCLLFMCINGLWSGTWSPSITYIVKMTPLRKRNIAITVRQTSIRFGFTVGPIVAGWLWEYLSPDFTFYGSTLFFALSLILLFPLIDDRKTSRS